LGIEKCRQKARTAVWWPKISQDIERLVKACPACSHWKPDIAEPFLPSELPQLPWQKIATDLFELNSKAYLVIEDYYSRYIELKQLKAQTSNAVITALKATIARHGIPMVCVSDNGPCYSSDLFKQFASSYGFTHATSSPRYAQSNGAAERAVQTVKALLGKSADPHLALLSYRTTPLLNGLSPAQLLMGRQLRSTVPLITCKLAPQTPDANACAKDDAKAKERQRHHYDRRHRTRSLSSFTVGDEVWVSDMRCNAQIVAVLPNRVYSLRSATGSIIRRNRRLLRAKRHPSPTSDMSPDYNISHAPARCMLREQTTPPATQPNQHQPVPYVTRHGRVVKRPSRFGD